jgi:hypothetical protein
MARGIFERYHYWLWIPCIYLVLYAISHLPLAWGHRLIFPDTPYALLIFLPAGLRLLSTWYFGARAILPLFFGALLTIWVYGHYGSTSLAIAQALVGSVSAYLAFELFRICGYDLYASPSTADEAAVAPHWRNLFLVGLFFSVFNGLLASILYYNTLSSDNLLPFLLIYIAGDMVGLLVVLMALMAGMRIASSTFS